MPIFHRHVPRGSPGRPLAGDADGLVLIHAASIARRRHGPARPADHIYHFATFSWKVFFSAAAFGFTS